MVLLTENIYDFDLAAALSEISEQRREQALRYKRELDVRLSVKAYLLLCKGLHSTYGIHEKPLFNYNIHGKPILADYPHIHFNISHCDKAILCAIDKQPIGVDIESIKEYDEEVAHYTMNKNEILQIESSSHPNIEFTRLWTMKEAVLKQSGKGITNHMKDILSMCNLDLTTVISSNVNYVYSICRIPEH